MDQMKALINLPNLVDIADIADALALESDEEDHTPCFNGHNGDSWSVCIDFENQSFYCADPTCRRHGNVVDLVHYSENVEYWEAADFIAGHAGLDGVKWNNGTLSQDLIVDLSCLREAARFYALHLDAAMKYLAVRGISRETAERYLVGASPDTHTMKDMLKSWGFTDATLKSAGLLNDAGEDFFRGRLVVPIRVNGLVIGFYGRAVDDSDPVSHLMMKNDRRVTATAPFNWNARREEIILVEGVLDALALIDRGYRGAVATMGTRGMASPEWLEMVKESSVKRVYVCYDGDEAGDKATRRDAFALSDLGLDVRIVDLGTDDPNEFLLKHDASEFKERLGDAVPPVKWEIDRVDDMLGMEAKIALLEPALQRAKQMRPLQQASVVAQAATKLGLTKKAVRDHIAALPEETAPEWDLLDLSNCSPIHPALDVVEDTVIMSVPQASMNHDTGSIEWQPFAVTSKRDFFPVNPTDLQKRGFYTTSTIMADEPRHSAETVKGFLSGDLVGDLTQTFWAIHGLLKQYVDFDDEDTYVFLTAWIMGTYLYPLFNYYPYIHFTGTKNVGKSKTMKLMSLVCFNGTMSVSISTASQFRIIEALRPTLFMDESEDLKDRAASDRRAVLLGGYEAGSSVIRTEREKDTFKAKRMGNYGPRAFASIEGLDDTLASRTVQITMQRSYNEEIKQREISLRDPKFQEIRDQLFLFALTEGYKVKAAYEKMERPAKVEFGDREFNLYRPLLAIAEATGDPKVVDSLIRFANEGYRRKIAEHNATAPENVLLRYLLETVNEDGWHRSDDIHAGFVKFIKESGFDLNTAITKAYMGGLVKKLGLISESKRSPDRTCTLYYIKLDALTRIAANYQVF